MTTRLLKAIRNPYIDIISHPSARLINRRSPVRLNWLEVLDAAIENHTILEINASPLRLDLEASKIHDAKKAGLKLIIDSDTHGLEDLNRIGYGVNEARRGWAEKSDIINTFSLTHLTKTLKRNLTNKQ